MLKKIINWLLEKPTMNPFITIMLVFSFLGFFSYNIQYFELDASSDSLLLENDEDLRYYRNIKARYGDDEFLVVTISPDGDLFDERNIDLLTNLKNDLPDASAQQLLCFCHICSFCLWLSLYFNFFYDLTFILFDVIRKYLNIE